MRLPSMDFESIVSAIPPRRQELPQECTQPDARLSIGNVATRRKKLYNHRVNFFVWRESFA